MDLPFFSRDRATWHDPEWHDPEVGGASLTAHEIYRRIRFGVGTESLGLACSAAWTLADRYGERAAQITELNRKMGAAWQGTASDAAQSVLPPLSGVFHDSHPLLGEIKSALESQSHAYWEAFRKVENVPAQPPSSGLLDDINPFATDTDRAISDYTAKASTNVAIYQAYSAQSKDNGAKMLVPYPHAELWNGAPITVRPGSARESAAWSDVAVADGQRGTIALGTNKNGSQPLTEGKANQPGQQAVVTHQWPDQITSQDQSAMPGTVAGPSAAPTHGLTAQQHAPGGHLVPGAGGQPDFGPTPAQPGTITGYPSPNTDWTVLDGRGTGSGRPGGQDAERTLAGGRNGLGAVPVGRGMGPGQPGLPLRARLGGVDSSVSAGRGTTAFGTGAQGNAGHTPLGPGAGRHNGDDDDTEYNRRYLIAPDPDSLFGTDEVVAPSVIGVDNDDDSAET